MSETYFSVIVPVYNVAPYVEKCIDTLLEEEFEDYEIIIVDDGSTDGSSLICDRYAQDNIKVIHKENGGLASARNAGLDIADGKYILWIDSDDWSEKGFLSELYRMTEDGEPDIIKFNYTTRPDGVMTGSVIRPGKYSREKIETLIIPKALKDAGGVVLSACSHAYKKSFLDENGLRFVSERIVCSEDWLFNCEAYLCAGNMTVCDKSFYNYFSRDGSLSKRYKPEQTKQFLNLHRYTVDFYKEKGFYERYKKEFAESLKEKMFGLCIRNECYLNETQTYKKAYEKTLIILKNPEFKEAVNECLRHEKIFKERIKLLLMKYEIAAPLMHLHIRDLKRRGEIG